MTTITTPYRGANADRERQALTKQADQEPPTDTPAILNRDAIKEAPNLFQPRFESIAYAPGRSEGHIAELARIAKQGRELDPVTIAAFGDEWYLIDGHHRLAAYAEAGWTKPIPVHPIHSDLRGNARVNWAIEQSFADNQKNRLNISSTDKMDGAWQAIARYADASKAHVVKTFGVSDGIVGQMRRTRKELEGLGLPPLLCVHWRTARIELRRLKGDEGDTPAADFSEIQRRKAARALQPVMEMRLTPDQLAEMMEEFSPGIVEMMAASQRDRLGLGEE